MSRDGAFCNSRDDAICLSVVTLNVEACGQCGITRIGIKAEKIVMDTLIDHCGSCGPYTLITVVTLLLWSDRKD